ncbi:hypothetical protein R6Q59_009842 [Mikania micrantha]
MDWKAEFLSKPSISIRNGIADKNGEPYEDTSTIVLTAPSCKFVDIRFPLKIDTSDGLNEPSVTLHPSFWAFSGTSKTIFYDAHDDTRPGFPYTAHTVFTHDIDSKGPGIIDEGTSFLLPSGDVMEVGVWPDSKQLFKELWTSPQPLPGQEGVLKSPTIVVETIYSGKGRGILIRIGNYIQGVFQSPSILSEQPEVRFVRATKGVRQADDNGKCESIAWTIDSRSSSDLKFIPVHLLQQETLPSLGNKFECHGDIWEVTEVS